jgi:hypothetical protein
LHQCAEHAAIIIFFDGALFAQGECRTFMIDSANKYIHDGYHFCARSHSVRSYIIGVAQKLQL